MIKRASRNVVVLLSLFGCCGAWTAASAEDGANPQSTADSSETLGTVVVTAQKRAQKLQDVPIAVSAFDKKQLEERGIENVLDLNALGPGLQISKTPSNSTISQISIRGITEINPAIYWDPAVGIYLDGVYIGKSQGSVFDVVDLARVEVLRGPQGTLYGRNTIAGAINLVTAKPSGVFGGQASLEVGNYGELAEKISVDLPRWGIASVSVGARSEQRDGWVTGAANSSADELNNRKNTGLHLAANFALAPGFQADYSFDHTNIDQNPAFAQLYRADAGFFTFVGFPDQASYASQERQTVANIDAPVFEHSRVQGHSLTFTWDVNDANTFKSISAYRHLDWRDSLDLDGSPNDVAFTQRFTKYHQWSQELQWVGHINRLNYVGGLYYFTDDGFTNNPQHFFGHAANFDSQYGTHSNAYAAFAQLDYRVIDPLTLTLGYRYTGEKKALDRIFGFAGSAPADYLIPSGTHFDKTFYAGTPVFAADYKFNEHLNVYARYAYGFKSGGFNGEYSNTMQSSAENVEQTSIPFKPEKQRSLEFGLKSNFLDNRAQLSAAIFQNKAKDLQESVFVGGGSSAAASVIRNAGSATIRGVELEGAFVVVKGTTLRANYAYLDPKYDEFIDFDPTLMRDVNAKDNRVFPHAPRNSFNVVLDTRLARFSWGTLRALADYAYTSSIYTYPYQRDPNGTGGDSGKQIAADSQVQGYGLLNLSLALARIPIGESASGEVALWCRNCINEDVPANFIDFGPGFGSLTPAYFIDPVTFGITGTVRW